MAISTKPTYGLASTSLGMGAPMPLGTGLMSQAQLAASAAPTPTWPFVTKRFIDFLHNIKLTEAQIKDGETKFKGVVSCLNQAYYGTNSETDHAFYIGSWAKKTRVRPPRDVDLYFLLSLVQVPEGMATLSQKLRGGHIDWIGNQLLTTPENRREFDFVRPSYASIQLTSVQHEDDNRDFLSLDDLVGKKLGVLAQTGIEGQARAALGKSVVAYARIEDALKDLAVKKLDVVLEENLIAEYYIERDDLPVKVTAPFAPPIPVGLAVHKGRRETQDKLADAVKTMLKDGSLKAISEKWFGYDVSRASMGHAMSS